MSNVVEILLAQIWNSQWFDQPLSTTDGQTMRVVYPGLWSHGFGPDFRNAMLELDGRLVSGDIEVDLDASGWVAHGHDRNDAFDGVILQVVAKSGNLPAVRTSSGATVPRVILTDYLRGPLDEFPAVDGLRPLGAIGFDTCAATPAAEHPDIVRDVCERAGDRRMQKKVSAMSGELAMYPPAQVLYARLLDALGFSRNRAPMAEVAARLTADQLDLALNVPDNRDRFWRAAALLLGVGGFLPLSPRDAASAGIEPARTGTLESLWREIGAAWHGIEVSPGFWSLARIRPAAHPVRRLLAGAVIVSAATGGLVEHLLATLNQSSPERSLRRWLADENPFLGKDHAREVLVNVIIPFGLAYGEQAAQPGITDASADLWQSLGAGRGNAVTRQTLRQICGDNVIRVKSARAEQGLLHINRNGCSQMRCFECPISHLALRWESGISPDRSRL